MTEQTREAVDSYIGGASTKPGEFLFGGRRGRDRPITTRQYAGWSDERSMRRTPRPNRLLSFDSGSPVARDAAEKPPWRTTCAKYCRSFRSCNDAPA
jgi:hypothetical protein